jgi:transcriptional regulator with XRE-family HTH domain
MGTRETRAQRGRRRGREITNAAVAQLRDARVLAGLSQRTIAGAIGWNQQHYSRFEAGRVTNAPLRVFVIGASLLGLDVSVSFHPVGPALRDKGHEAVIERFLKLLNPAWRVVRELPFPTPGDPRFWDLTLRIGAQLVGIEVETRIRDVQALVRRMRERGRDGGADVIVIVLSDSAHNRELVDQFREALGQEFAIAPRDLLAALRAGTALPGSGVVLL